MKFDRTNQKILNLLERNARLSATAIGKEIGLSRTAVQDRIARLERDGIIAGYTAVLSAAAPKSLRALLFVAIAERPCAPVLSWLRSLQGVERVHSLAGDIDAVVAVSVPLMEDLTRLNDQIGRDKRISHSVSQIVLSTL